MAFVRRREGRGRRLQVPTLAENLDAAFGLLEAGMTEARQLDTTLVQRERLLERQVAFLELLHDRIELGDRCLEVPDGGVGGVGHTGASLRRSGRAPRTPARPWPASRGRGRRG